MANSSSLLLPLLAIAGVVGVIAATTTKSGSPPEPAQQQPTTPAPPVKHPPDAVPPKDVIDRIVGAVSTRNPEAMRKLAQQIEDEGWPLQANDLRRAADVAAFLDRNALNPPGPINGEPLRAPAKPQPWSPIPGVLPPQRPEPELQPKRLQAQIMVNDLLKHGVGKEDRKIVAAFQAQNGLKASGNYTPATAMCLAETYGLVPPTPYWPTSGRTKAKENYRKRMLALAERDPQRAEEFREAAKRA